MTLTALNRSREVEYGQSVLLRLRLVDFTDDTGIKGFARLDAIDGILDQFIALCHSR